MNLKLTYDKKDEKESLDRLSEDDASRLEVYKTRNQFNSSKASNDNFIGDIVELCVLREFQKIYKGHDIFLPPGPRDKTLNESLNKEIGINLRGHNPDIIIDKNILYWHVKSCRQNSSFPVSFIFQQSHHDNMLRNIDKLHNHYLICGVVDQSTRSVNIVISQKYDLLLEHHDKIFGPPVSHRLRGIKMCLYYNKLIEHGIDPIVKPPKI